MSGQAGEREAFEKWAESCHLHTRRDGDTYFDKGTKARWVTWRAARAAEAPDISKLASSIVHYVLSEIRPRPDDPSCHVCGAIMVPSKFRCLSCGGETGVNGQAAEAPAPCEACELENKTGDEYANHACRTAPTGAREFWDSWESKKYAKPSPEIVAPVCIAFAEACAAVAEDQAREQTYPLGHPLV